MEIGELWNGWKVEKFIGEGSFGKVYQIKKEEFGHTYEAALKIIEIPQNQSEVESIKNEGMDDESVTLYFRSIVEEFIEEFVLMSKLKGNSNIVSYEDHYVVPKDPFGWKIYIRMELLTPLYSYLKTHTLTIREVTQLGIDMCQALEICQKYNIIHRDIKPENIFISNLGKFKLGDFGIARQLEKTSSGLSKKGTYTYMAPEVYKGLPYNSTVDIYSLGIVLYRFLNNNRTPFMPPSPQPIRYSDKENANILRLSGKEMENPANAEGRLAEIVLRACSYKPGARYESAVEMKEALQSILYSESEAKIIYPMGDDLLNTDLSYMTNSKELISRDNKKNIEENTEENPTVYLFKSQQIMEGEKGKNEQTDIEEDIEQQTEVEEKIGPEERIESEKEDTRQDIREKTEDKIEKKAFKSVGRKRIVMVAAAFLVILCIAGGIKTYQKSLEREVPNLINMPIETAQEALKEKDLVLVQSEKEYSDTVKKDCIILQQYKPGDIVKKDSEVKVTVSKGALLIVPDVTNISQEEAKKKTGELGLQCEIKGEQYSDQVKAGMIISQEPEAGNKVEENSQVYIIVSKGIEKKEVPSLVGLTSKEAKKQLKEQQLKCKSDKSYSDSVKEGQVISQNIEAGKKIDKNSTVNIVISKGKKPVPKPVTTSPSNSKTRSSGSSSGRRSTTNKKSPTQKKSSGKKKKKSGSDSLDSWDLVN